MRSYWVWGGTKFIRTGVLKRKGKLGHRDTDAQGLRPWTGRGRGWSGASASQGLPGCWQPSEARRDKEGSSSRAFGESMASPIP